MRCFLLVLTVVGGLMPVAAAVWVYRQATTRHDRLRRESDRIRELAAGDQRDQMSDILRAAGIDFTTYADLTTVKQDMGLGDLQAGLSSLKGPALFAVIGVVLSTVASAWSLYL